MKALALLTFLLTVACVLAQSGHDLQPVEAMKALAFMEGDWKGRHIFNAPTPTELDVKASIHAAVGGRYLEDVFVTTREDGTKSDVRHLLTFDPAIQKFRAWWFNNTSLGPTELVGEFSNGKLILESKAGQSGPPVRGTYEKVSDTQLGYKVEAKMGEQWRELLHTVFTKN